jgi:tetratricopeptide (TPR) repeat protein
MAQPATNPKIEELRFRVKTDPKSRLFFPLAEELRKAGQFAEAEQVLQQGLTVHPTYLSAWVSLGRVLRDQRKDGQAVDALSRALQLDPGNVVAARILADSYLAVGDKLEAIKKYKLVHALMPADEELKGIIERLDADLKPPAPVEVAPTPEPAFEESPFDKTQPPFDEEHRVEIETGDVEPMHREHDESPFEERVSTVSSASLEGDAPQGMSIVEAPLAAEVPAPVTLPESDDESEVFAPAAAAPEPPAVSDVANTLTMADLYAKQGLVEDARHIYENILARDPSNEDVRRKLEAIAPRINPRIARLEQWLAKVSKREVGRV